MSPDFGKHLLEVEDLLQKHALLENDIALQAERVQNASAAALKFANGDSKCSDKCATTTSVFALVELFYLAEITLTLFASQPTNHVIPR